MAFPKTGTPWQAAQLAKDSGALESVPILFYTPFPKEAQCGQSGFAMSSAGHAEPIARSFESMTPLNAQEATLVYGPSFPGVGQCVTTPRLRKISKPSIRR